MSSTATPALAMGLMQSLAASTEMGWLCPFTAAQWRELEHQALIFKYMIAGVPVPPDLLLPIQRSFETSASSSYHHYPSPGYFSYYGKKLDPEPGRCRRTDGKKWRCSKDAHPDSKYCERHMHRGRNRSRKHVESTTNISCLQSESRSSSSTTTSIVASGSNGSFKNITLQSGMAGVTKPQSGASLIGGNGCLDRAKIAANEHNFFSSYPRSSLDGSWGPSFPITTRDSNEVTISSLPKKLDLQHSYSRKEFDFSDHGKHKHQCLWPFNLPKARQSWIDLEDDQEQYSSATQLSISVPLASSDFSTTTSCSPYDD
ncbi:Growth-regulating factor 3 [Apostasia shenzhenica]|uniref:Growth-regulating factor n=1 Tax=Apostasia shenzhenica TaxID=1088818 RepID=A0A2H9ZWZ8_9ASPA|nr:Growth-regulating factor 3 [Apostasia shenzhenica]